MGFGGFDSSIILIQRGGILMSLGDFPESLSQAMLVGVMLLGRLGVAAQMARAQTLSIAQVPKQGRRQRLVADKWGQH